MPVTYKYQNRDVTIPVEEGQLFRVGDDIFKIQGSQRTKVGFLPDIKNQVDISKIPDFSGTATAADIFSVFEPNRQAGILTPEQIQKEINTFKPTGAATVRSAEEEVRKAQNLAPNAPVPGQAPLGQEGFVGFQGATQQQTQQQLAQQQPQQQSTQQQQPTGQAAPQEYLVQSGDTLSSIARRLGVNMADITGYRSGNPNLIYPGERLQIRPQVAQQQQATGQAQQAVIQPVVPPPTGGTDIFQPTGAIDTTKTIDDVIKSITTAFGMDAINKEMTDLDEKYADDVGKINENPWLSEGLRSKKITRLQEKYQTNKNALVDRLKLQQDVVGKAIDVYYKQKELEQNELFKVLDLESKRLDREIGKPTADIQEYAQAVSEGFTGSFMDYQERVANLKRPITNINLDQLLTPTEAATLGVPYGTTRADAAVLGITPLPSGQTGAEITKIKENAMSGIRAIQTIRDEIQRDPSVLLKSIFPGSTFARTFETARNEVKDVLTRLRTGAALNLEEQSFYSKQVPSLLDLTDPGTIEYKLNSLEQLFGNLSKRQITTTQSSGQTSSGQTSSGLKYKILP